MLQRESVPPTYEPAFDTSLQLPADSSYNLVCVPAKIRRVAFSLVTTAAPRHSAANAGTSVGVCPVGAPIIPFLYGMKLMQSVMTPGTVGSLSGKNPRSLSTTYRVIAAIFCPAMTPKYSAPSAVSGKSLVVAVGLSAAMMQQLYPQTA